MGAFRERIKQRRRRQAQAFGAAVEIGRALFGSNEAEYREYLIENGATPIEADSIILARRNGQVDGQQLKKQGNARRGPLKPNHPWMEDARLSMAKKQAS